MQPPTPRALSLMPPSHPQPIPLYPPLDLLCPRAATLASSGKPSISGSPPLHRPLLSYSLRRSLIPSAASATPVSMVILTCCPCSSNTGHQFILVAYPLQLSGSK